MKNQFSKSRSLATSEACEAVLALPGVLHIDQPGSVLPPDQVANPWQTPPGRGQGGGRRRRGKEQNKEWSKEELLLVKRRRHEQGNYGEKERVYIWDATSDGPTDGWTDGRTNGWTDNICQVSYVRCQMSDIRCQASGIRSQI